MLIRKEFFIFEDNPQGWNSIFLPGLSRKNMNFKKKDLISNHLKRSKVTHLKVWTWSLSIEFFVSLKYIRFRQRLMCLRTVLPLLIQLFTWIKMSRYTDSKRKHQNRPKFIQIKTIWSLNKFGHHKCPKDIQNVKNVRFFDELF